jgi:signal transduction histidine kinase
MRIWVAVLWTSFTVALVGWWWLFTYRLLSIRPETEALVDRGSRMLFYEGGTLFLLVLAGGLGLIFYMYQDQRREQRERLFYATFNHDIKTSISRLKLQAEFLVEEGPSRDKASDPVVLQRLIQDMDRLELQLENALLLSAGNKQVFVTEDLRVSEILKGLRFEFPDLEIALNQDLSIRADRRAMTSVLRNLIQNAHQHGKARRVQISTQQATPTAKVVLTIQDDGKVNQESSNPDKRSSSGMGLSLCRQLLNRMNGKLEASASDQGFYVRLEVPGAAGARG